ncbi:MAG: tetratricopeptide repeat protein [Acidobacteria bacterium]|nr:tetratricopeptide repeat protein [Candidatus Sulfomarinibacter kjeldsenii]
MHESKHRGPPSNESVERRPFLRMRLSRRLVLNTVLGMTVALLITPVATADYWYEHYARAESALGNGNWDSAVEELQQALERKGDSGARVRYYGMRVRPYFPYLKLGIAYYHLGHYEAALQAFQTEEQLGAIHASEVDLAELNRYRSLTLTARTAAENAEGERIATIVRESLRDAEILERQGRLAAAMEALGEGLAVDPENSDSVEKMKQLRTEVVRLERERLDDTRAADLVSRGRILLDEENYTEASSLFRQALSIRPGGEAQQLLGQARAGLLAEIQAYEDAETRQAIISTGLAEARELESVGQHSGALDHLQPVLAAEPQNREALALQQRILASQRDSTIRDSLEAVLSEAQTEFAAGHFERSISAANRALALDPGNGRALEHVRLSYAEISRRLLGSRTIENIPPAIRFADLRTDQADGARAQLVQSPDFRLSGVVIDTSPVDVTFEGPAGRRIEGSSTSQPVGEIFVTEFALDDALSDGSTTYKLVATDNAGLNSSAEYTVIYSMPFFRSLAFQITIAAIPIAVLGAVWVHRARRRRQLMKRRFNPYIAGAPVLDIDMFFGRDQLVERILQTIHNNSLLLYGERRIGKTSLQHHLRRRLQQLDDPRYEFFPVYVDLQGTPESQFFSTLAEDVFHELAPLLGGIRPGEDLDESSVYGYRDLVRDLRKVIKILKEKSAKQIKLVLLIDEVDELNAYDPRINQRLRSLFMKSFAENLVAVVSGVEIRKQWDKEGSPWYNFFEEIEVTPIGRDETVELITRPIGGVFKIDRAVTDRIIELTDRKPYHVQRLCVALVNRMHEQGRRVITTADVDAVAGNNA